MRVPGARFQMQEQALHTMQMIRALPQHAHVDNDALDGDVRVACLESFFMHIRGIADFLCCRPGFTPDPRDFSARDFVPGWQATPADAARRLAEHWDTASQLIAHFSRQRLQLVHDPAELTHLDTSLAGLEAIADDADAVWKVFDAASGRAP